MIVPKCHDLHFRGLAGFVIPELGVKFLQLTLHTLALRLPQLRVNILGPLSGVQSVKRSAELLGFGFCDLVLTVVLDHDSIIRNRTLFSLLEFWSIRRAP